MSLPAEKVAELRQAVHCQVSKMAIQQQIQRCLADCRDQPLDEAGVLELLERRGVVDSVMQALQLGGRAGGGGGRGERRGGGGGRGRGGEEGIGGERGRERGGEGGGDGRRKEGGECDGDEQWRKERWKEEEEDIMDCVSERDRVGKMVTTEECLDHRTGEEMPRKGLHPNKRYILLRVDGGRAFLDHLQHSHTLCSTTLTLHVSFRGQRVHSRPVPCVCEPDFSEGFLLELVDGRGGREGEGRLMSYSDALSISEPICLVITRTNERGERDLLGTHSLDWRPVLTEERGKTTTTGELSGVGSEAKISPGLLELRLEVFPKAPPLQSVFLSAHGETERLQTTERERLFLVYSKQWWQEFLQIRPEHGRRLVKIFAQDETGRSRCVCSFVRPLRAGRLLDGSRHAARFVSLVPFETNSRQDVEDHSTLLCSLLLGYGLEAYVCVGAKARGLAHSWVATIGSEGAITFWESLTGQRYRYVTFDPNTQAGTPPPSPNHPYRTIGCLFNHTSFLANAQPTDSILTCSFNLRNRSLWKPMSSEAIQAAGRHRSQLPWTLVPPTLDPLLTANTMELELRALLTQHRSDLGLSTLWDDALCYLLAPALASYELERCVGVSAGNEEFQDAVRGHVQEGHTFKGFPIQLTHMNPRQAFSTCLRSPVCTEIASCRGDQVRMAVRVKVYSYPEDIVAVWIMFAVTYRSVL